MGNEGEERRKACGPRSGSDEGKKKRPKRKEEEEKEIELISYLSPEQLYVQLRSPAVQL